MNTHERYEELCALAASGQLSLDELENLQAHLATCPSCKSLESDLTVLSAQGLSQVAARRISSPVPAGMTRRFIARARSEGIDISRASFSQPQHSFWTMRWAVGAAVAVSLLVAGLVAAGKLKLLQFSSEPQQTVLHATFPAPAAPAAEVPDGRSQAELSAARAQVNSMSTMLRQQRTELASSTDENKSLNSRLVTFEQQMTALEKERRDSEARIQQLQVELEKTKSDKNAGDVVAALQETELKELRKQLADQSRTLDQQEALVSRGSDVRDLVVARNLHIIDVHDRNDEGKPQRAFGRIFYAEGKSLTFYAYDLADQRKFDAKVSFYVWGERLGAEKPAQNLGIFHSDDPTDGRWVLTFDDPRVLTQIDSVFVTAESSRKTAREPRGQRILFAFLGGKPNHP